MAPFRKGDYLLKEHFNPRDTAGLLGREPDVSPALKIPETSCVSIACHFANGRSLVRAMFRLTFPIGIHGRLKHEKTLRTTPAMGAGIAKHVWSVEEIGGPLDSK